MLKNGKLLRNGETMVPWVNKGQKGHVKEKNKKAIVPEVEQVDWVAAFQGAAEAEKVKVAEAKKPEKCKRPEPKEIKKPVFEPTDKFNIFSDKQKPDI